MIDIAECLRQDAKRTLAEIVRISDPVYLDQRRSRHRNYYYAKRDAARAAEDAA